MSDKLIDQISAPLVSNYLETAKDLKEQMNLSIVDSNISSNLQISQVYSYLTSLPNDADSAKKKDVVYNWSTYMSYKYGKDEELITSCSGNPINVNRVNANSIRSLIVAGKTTQAGTGDPSPTNIRPISGVGAYDKSITFDGSSDESWGITTDSYQKENYALFYIHHVLSDGITASDREVYTAKTNHLPVSSVSKTLFDTSFNDIVFAVGNNNSIYLYLRKSDASTLQEFRTYLANHPLTVWYQSTTYQTSSTYYEVASMEDDSGYHAYAIQTDAPLFDGDSADIVSGKVHRKWKIYTFTGEENWIVDNSSYDSFFIDDDNELNGKYIIPSNIICSHFMADDASSMAIDSLGILLQGNAMGVVQISNGDTNLDAANFKTWVKSQYNAGTPLQILYELTVPNNIDTSGNTIAIQRGSVLIKSENTIDLKLPIYSDYTKNSDYIFTGDLYNTLCDNITTEYANYLKTGLSVDLGTFAIAYQLMLSDFCDNINNFIDTFNEIYQENICNNQNSVPLLQIQKDKNTNTLIATSPALIKAGKADITNNTLPSALELYYNYIINKKCCKVKIIYADSIKNGGLTYSNTRIHRIREIK